MRLIMGLQSGCRAGCRRADAPDTLPDPANPERRAVLLTDKVAVVTGVGPGLGRAAALALAREGATVGVVARTESRLEEVVTEIEGAGGRALAIPGNVASAEDCARVAETVTG